MQSRGVNRRRKMYERYRSQAKPISSATRQKGEEFVALLLEEGHKYESIKVNFLGILATFALNRASKQLAGQPGAVVEPSGIVRGSVLKAAEMLDMTRNRFSEIYHGAGQ